MIQIHFLYGEILKHRHIFANYNAGGLKVNICKHIQHFESSQNST